MSSRAPTTLLSPQQPQAAACLPDQGNASATIRPDDVLPLNNPDAFAHQHIFEEQDVAERVDVVEYLRNPFTRQSEPGKETIVVSSLSPRWLHCHHKVFPAFWKCMACPPNNCFDRWDVGAMEDQGPNYRPFCSRSNCGAPASSQSVLVNTQKESIMTLAGKNLMASRVEEPLMWCCSCAAFRGHGGGQNPDCAHCINFEESSCPDCVRCNKFLEPTKYGNGEVVQYGVVHLQARALDILAGREPADARCASVMFNTAYGLDDPVRAWSTYHVSDTASFEASSRNRSSGPSISRIPSPRRYSHLASPPLCLDLDNFTTGRNLPLQQPPVWR
ncbi:hypothetical protein B0I37DRAFT_421201 [Chaetomium sp. MPI-CAGE-AT-0009]|nr:hypothetical protein B0I37DRAFT_421201 [Chaetomium sp. MPI-CAGE-AT-0009]